MNAKIFKSPTFASFLSSLKIQRQVIFAIYFKVMKVRFGSNNWGLFLTLMEPMAHVAVFSLIFYFKSRDSYHMEYPIFVMLGILPWLLFKNIVRRSITAISSNRPFFNYPNVRPLDAILARAFLEINIFIFVTASLCLIFYLFGFDAIFKNFVGFVYAIFLVVIMALGFGIIFAVLDSYYHAAQRILNMTFRPLYFMSGIFYPVSIIPEPYRSYFLYNPILQGVLLVRHGHTPEYDDSYANPEYLTVFAFEIFSIGIFYYALHWKNVAEKH